MSAGDGNGRNWPTTIGIGTLIVVTGAIGVRFWKIPEEISVMSADIKIISARMDGIKDSQTEDRARILDLERFAFPRPPR
jgi:hypothetical protein